MAAHPFWSLAMPIPIRSLIRFTALALVLVTAGFARAQPDPGGLVLHTDGLLVPALALSSDVDIEVTGMLARTLLTQTFVNRSGAWAEGRYTFPLPEGVSVDRLEIRIGERRISGELREKSDARAVYARASANGQSAALFEQQRGNLFSTALTNIAPNETIEVRIGYSEVIEFEHGRFRLRFPTTALPRYANRSAADVKTTAEAHGQSPMFVAHRPAAADRLDLTVTLHPGIEIGPVTSLHHAIRALPGSASPTFVLARPDEAAGRDFELQWAPARPDRLNGALLIEQRFDRGHALLMLVPPASFRPERLARDLTLVIDRSGSMQGAAFEQARAAVRMALDRIGADDRFNLIAFNHQAEPLFEQVEAPTPANMRRAYGFLDRLVADGGTEIDAALAHAMQTPATPGRLRQIVFVTDGAVANEDQVLELIRRRIGSTRLFAIGIGHGVNDAFLLQAARAGRGTLTRIADPRDIATGMDELFAQLAGPVLTDLEILWPAGIDAERWPDPLPDLYAGQPMMLLAKLDIPERQLRGEVRLEALHDLQPFSMSWPLERYLNAPGIAEAWARSRIDGLQALLPGVMDEQLRQDEMLLTALEYGIVSRQTSLVAVDRTPRRTRDAALKRQQLALTAPADRRASASTLLAMPATDAGTGARLLRGLAIGLILVLLLFNRRFQAVPASRPGMLPRPWSRP